MTDFSFGALISGSNKFTRRFGGNTLGNSVDPYITGYCFIKMAYMPEPISAYMRESSTVYPPISMNKTDISNVLESSVLSVTLPGGTMNKAEFQGLGGTKYAVPTYQDIDNTFSMRFTEFQGTPIMNIIRAWTKMMRDYRSGVSRITPIYTKSNYAGSMFYWTTLPDGVTIQYASLLTGIYPTRYPSDLFGHDITNIDKLEIDVDFNVDYLWEENWVSARCAEYAEQAYTAWNNGSASSVIEDYGYRDSITNV